MLKAPLTIGAGIFLIWLWVDRNAVRHMQSWMAWVNADPRRHRALAMGIIVIWTIFFCYLKAQQQKWFKTGLDLAIYASLAWHMVHGPLFYDSILDRNLLGHHFSPIFLVIGLLYRLYEDPMMLMVLQTIGLGAGAVALYLIAVRILGYTGWTIAALLLYLFHFYLHIAHHIEFHTSLLGIPILLWLLYFAERSARIPVLLCAALAMTVEEVVVMGVAAVGLYLAFFNRTLRAVGIVCAVVACLQFALVVGVVMPAINHEPGGHLLWSRYEHLGASFSEALENLLRHPVWALNQAFVQGNRWYYVLALVGSFGFLPVLAWRQALFAALPILLLLLNRNPSQYKLGFHYSAAALPLLYYSMVYGLAALRDLLTRYHTESQLRLRLAGSFTLVLLAANILQIPGYNLSRVDSGYVDLRRSALAKIPERVSVAASSALVTQLVNRDHICYVTWRPGELCFWGAPEYVILELGARRDPNLAPGDELRYVDSLVTDLGYTILHQGSDLVILHGHEKLGPEFAPAPSRYT